MQSLIDCYFFFFFLAIIDLASLYEKFEDMLSIREDAELPMIQISYYSLSKKVHALISSNHWTSWLKIL